MKTTTYKTEHSGYRKLVRTNNKRTEIIIETSAGIRYDKFQRPYETIEEERFEECAPKEFFLMKARYEEENHAIFQYP